MSHENTILVAYYAYHLCLWMLSIINYNVSLIFSRISPGISVFSAKPRRFEPEILLELYGPQGHTIIALRMSTHMKRR